MRNFVIFIFFCLLVNTSLASVFDCYVKYKFGTSNLQHRLLIQYEITDKNLTMPLYEWKEKNSLEFKTLGIELAGTGLVKFDNNEVKLFITNYWSKNNDLRGFFLDPYDYSALITFNVKYGEGKSNEELLINLYMSKPVAGEPFRTGFCKKL